MPSTHIDPRSFVKLASGIRRQASSRPDRWVNEAIEMLLEAHPYLAQYSAVGELVQSDAERMYGAGFITLRAPSESQLSRSGIRIPFLVDQQSFHPMKVFISPDGSIDYLAKDIVLEHLFDPSLSNAISESLPDRSTSGMLSPPFHPYSFQLSKNSSAPSLGDDAEEYLASQGLQVDGETRRRLHKEAQARMNSVAPLLPELEGTFRKEDQSLLDPNVQAAFALSKRSELLYPIMRNYREKKASRLSPTVVQVERLSPLAHRVKTANPDAFETSSNIVSAKDMEALVGEDRIPVYDAEGRLTISSTPAIQQNMDDFTVKPIEEYGVYKVQDLNGGEQKIGWVITNVLNFDMIALPQKIWTNGQDFAVQETIVGSVISQGTNLPRKVPETGDHGSFYQTTAHGTVTAFSPVTVTHLEIGESGQSIIACIDTFGLPLRLQLLDGLKRAIELGDREYAIPSSCLFLPLTRETHLVPNVELFSKMAKAGDNIEIQYNGSYFLKGSAFDHLDPMHRTHLKEADAELLLACAGVLPQTGRMKMAQAVINGKCMAKGRAVVGKRQRDQAEAKLASLVEGKNSRVLAQVRKETVKIAAILPPMAKPQSVDAVLSLNFITPENLALFVDAVPRLVTARRDLSNLYFSSLLGLPDVSSVACIRAVEALHETIQGLKTLRMRSMLV